MTFERAARALNGAQENSPAGRESTAKVTPDSGRSHQDFDSIVPLITFLASAENANMVGQVVYSDGGREVLTRGESVP
jgi:hypothetical protein